MVSEKTLKLLGSMLVGVLQQPLQSETEFWSASKTLNVLAVREELMGSEGRVDWPQTIRRFISPSKFKEAVATSEDSNTRTLQAKFENKNNLHPVLSVLKRIL